jgi:outer membrane receptor protein involved in Fe transport
LKTPNRLNVRLLACTSLATLLLPFAATAQQAANSSPSVALDEVVVTATRREDTVNRVPLSVAAFTQRSLDQQGVRSVQDLARTVPSLKFQRTGTDQGMNISVRGVLARQGAATTGVYLDDTPLTKRNLVGPLTNNGVAVPELFDLERVEVLRGPQGVLFGGSSEGGAVRFIMPAPSLSKYSAYGQGDLSSTKGGGLSYGLGVQVGGPIVQDKLGFRAAVYAGHTGGYIDHVSIYDAHTISSNTNSGDRKSMRLALAWAPTPQLTITPAIYASLNRSADQDLFMEDVPQFTINAGVFTNRGTINGVAYSAPPTSLAGGVFGPYNQFGPYKIGSAYYLDEKSGALPVSSPSISRLFVPSLTIDYETNVFSVKVISSLIDEANKSLVSGGFSVRAPALSRTTTAGFVDAQTGQPVAGGTGPILFVPGFPQMYNRIHLRNERDGGSQEVRISSKGDSRLNWVVGAFYSDMQYQLNMIQNASESAATAFLHGGLTASYFNGGAAIGDVIGQLYQDIRDRELAAFGEANYRITSKLKITAGVRVSRVKTASVITSGGGSFYAPPPGFVATAAKPFPSEAESFSTFQGEVSETPITPKFGLSYQLTDNDMLYLSAAKGFRAGGVNAINPNSLSTSCAPDIARLGGVPPQSYNSDSVWSYEGGAKARVLGGRAQINSSIYYIEWNKPQLQLQLPTCRLNYIDNAGKAVSKGFDIDARVRLFEGLTLNASLAYTNAAYSKTLYTVPNAAGVSSIIVNKGDELGAPKWQYNIGLEYAFQLASRYDAYVRGDYQYAGKYMRGVGPGAIGYDPVTVQGEATQFVTARAGVRRDHWELSVFVNNLTNSQDRLFVNRPPIAPVVYSSTYRPREIGMQLSYRY